MHCASRLILILAGMSAWLIAMQRPDFKTLFDSSSYLWNLHALAEKWDALESESALCDQRFAAMRQIYEGRRKVIDDLLEGRLDLREAITRFSALNAVRKESGLVCPVGQESLTRAGPETQLLIWIEGERKERTQKPEADKLEQVEAELRCLVEFGH